jgi:hypothetical protein
MEDMFESLLEQALMGQRLLASGFDLRLFVVIAIVGTLGIIALFVYSLNGTEVNENE